MSFLLKMGIFDKNKNERMFLEIEMIYLQFVNITKIILAINQQNNGCNADKNDVPV
jgi:hypothetical protein